jgi:hypothetical protein
MALSSAAGGEKAAEAPVRLVALAQDFGESNDRRSGMPDDVSERVAPLHAVMLFRVPHKEQPRADLGRDPRDLIQLLRRKEPGFVDQHNPAGRLRLHRFADEEALHRVRLFQATGQHGIPRPGGRGEREEPRAAGPEVRAFDGSQHGRLACAGVADQDAQKVPAFEQRGRGRTLAGG